jgi:hypothetical protein
VPPHQFEHFGKLLVVDSAVTHIEQQMSSGKEAPFLVQVGLEGRKQGVPIGCLIELHAQAVFPTFDTD